MAAPKYPVSILDTDLYKLTMQQAVLHQFPSATTTYRFTNRSKDRFFSRACINRFRNYIFEMSTLQLSESERTWLARVHPFFSDDYLSYLASYRFEPSEILITFVANGTNVLQRCNGNEREPFPGDLDEEGALGLEITGLWSRTILWETPLMAALSQSYFETVDADWDNDGQEEHAYEKAKQLLQAGCAFSEFGTRRRRSLHAHCLVMKGLLRAQSDLNGSCQGRVVGTSNVYLAYKLGTKTSGTIAHEWFMAIAAMNGYSTCASDALSTWETEYAPNLMIALTDTFSTKIFHKEFSSNPERVRRWQGLRQDSGDPFVYAPRAKEIYQRLNIDHTTKTIIYSDALDVDRCIQLQKHCQEIGFRSAFGIGTNMSNDFRVKSSGGNEKSKALNIVIKLSSINGKPCVKLSDELTKNTGDVEAVRQVKELLGISIEAIT